MSINLKLKNNFYSNLNYREKITYKIYLFFTILEGIVFGITLMNEFVFIRSLKGSESLVGVLFLLSITVYFILFISNEITRRIRNKRKLITITAIFSRAPLIGFLFFPDSVNESNSAGLHFFFLILMFLYYLGTAITLPTINQLLKHNFRNNNFGKLYGYATTANKIAAMLSTLLFGILLDKNYFIFRYVYPAMGILGICGYIMLSRIPYNSRVVYVREKLSNSLLNSVRRMFKILKNDKAFRDFEIAYFSYGTAFMFSTTVVTFFLESHLNLSYSVISGYKTLSGAVTFLSLPLFGILMDKVDQRRFSSFMFSFMLMYLIFIVLTYFYPFGCALFGLNVILFLFLAFIMYGLFSSSGTLSWNVGTAFFTKDSQAVGDYHAIHITLTGLRGFLALLGVIIYQTWGYVATFSISALFVFLALLIIEISLKKNPLILK